MNLHVKYSIYIFFGHFNKTKIQHFNKQLLHLVLTEGFNYFLTSFPVKCTYLHTFEVEVS